MPTAGLVAARKAPVNRWVDDERLARLRRIAADLRQRMGDIAAAIAATEDSLADTLDSLARERPRDRKRLRARATDARRFAAAERDLAARCGGDADATPAGPAAGENPPRRPRPGQARDGDGQRKAPP